MKSRKSFPTKTLYANARDASVFDDAKLLSGGSLSQLVVTLLREWLKANDPDGSRRATLRKNIVEVKGA